MTKTVVNGRDWVGHCRLGRRGAILGSRSESFAGQRFHPLHKITVASLHLSQAYNVSTRGLANQVSPTAKRTFWGKAGLQRRIWRTCNVSCSHLCTVTRGVLQGDAETRAMTRCVVSSTSPTKMPGASAVSVHVRAFLPDFVDKCSFCRHNRGYQNPDRAALGLSEVERQRGLPRPM